MLKHLKNYFVAIHHNALAFSYLGTGTPLAYPLTMLIAVPAVTIIAAFDLDELSRSSSKKSEDPT